MMTLCLAVLSLAINQPAAQAPQNAPPAKNATGPYSSNSSQTIDIDLPSLKYFCDGKQSDLKRYIEASPRWRVGIERRDGHDLTIAYRRLDTRVTLNGFIGSKTQTRVGFVFEEKPSEPEFLSPCMTQVAPDAGATSVAICSYKAIPARRLAYLFVGVPNLWLATVEIDKVGNLEKTPGLLSGVESELSAVRKASKDGKPLSALSPTDTHKGAASLKVDDAEKQELDVEAWINPGEPGVTELRVKSGDGTKDLTISHAHLYARERIGYSEDSAQLFYANSKVSIEQTATGWNSKHDVLFQLWFTPDSGGPARKIIEHRQTISGWEN